ncbi:hypothetical protein WICMUC_005185 [Wickerhamomyces mucosus]|uniref:Uncharacterized protein n=1 Tax=Wickerhamomyces mucosus TaxID=1378264 RepID=A0A9P8P9J4_9ASCO|nr:hypothetical protein WICMUC_005185 [Wickerhamomyces mucosus]
MVSRAELFPLYTELYPYNRSPIDFIKFYQKLEASNISIDQLPSRMFEDLMEGLLSSSGNQRNKNYPVFRKIFNEMSEFQIPISLKEINSLVYLENYSSKATLLKLSNKVFVEMKNRRLEKQFSMITSLCTTHDISTYNIFLKYAILFNNDELVNSILMEINTKMLQYDRISYELLLQYFGCNGKDLDKSFEILKLTLEDNIKLDIGFINLIIKILVHNNQIQDSIRILNLIFTRYEKIFEDGNIDIKINTAHLRRISLEYWMFFDSLKLQQDSILIELVPNYNTISPILNYYSSLENFQLNELIKILKIMNHFKIDMTHDMYVNILSNFKQYRFSKIELEMLTDELEYFKIKGPKVITLLKELNNKIIVNQKLNFKHSETSEDRNIEEVEVIEGAI